MGIVEMQSTIIGQQGSKVGLAGEIGGQHVANVKRLRAQTAGVFNGSQHGLDRQRAQGNIPVFADGGLAYSCNDDISHKVSEEEMLTSS